MIFVSWQKISRCTGTPVYCCRPSWGAIFYLEIFGHFKTLPSHMHLKFLHSTQGFPMHLQYWSPNLFYCKKNIFFGLYETRFTIFCYNSALWTDQNNYNVYLHLACWHKYGKYTCKYTFYNSPWSVYTVQVKVTFAVAKKAPKRIVSGLCKDHFHLYSLSTVHTVYIHDLYWSYTHQIDTSVTLGVLDSFIRRKR